MRKEYLLFVGRVSITVRKYDSPLVTGTVVVSQALTRIILAIFSSSCSTEYSPSMFIPYHGDPLYCHVFKDCFNKKFYLLWYEYLADVTDTSRRSLTASGCK